MMHLLIAFSAILRLGFTASFSGCEILGVTFEKSTSSTRTETVFCKKADQVLFVFVGAGLKPIRSTAYFKLSKVK